MSAVRETGRGGDARSALADALRFERVRVRTIRSTWWLVAVAVLLSGVVSFGVAMASRREPLRDDLLGVVLTGGSAFSPLPFAAVAMALLGVLAAGHEYRHETIRPTLTAVPRRSAVVAAKLAVVALVAAATALLTVAVGWVVGSVVRGEPVAGAVGAALVGYVALVVLWAALGLALALLLRGIMAAATLVLVVPLVVEPLTVTLVSALPALEPLRGALRYLPFSAGQQLPQTVILDSGATPFAPLGRWAGGAVFALFVAALLAPAWALFERRDA